MPHLREEIDAEYSHAPAAITEFRTEQNPNEVICSDCGRRLFADNAAYDQISHGLKQDPDNQFVCDDCIDNSGEEYLTH